MTLAQILNGFIALVLGVGLAAVVGLVGIGALVLIDKLDSSTPAD